MVRYERAHSGTGWSKKPSAESKDSKRVTRPNRLRPQLRLPRSLPSRLRMLPPRSWNSGRFAARYAMPRLSRPRPKALRQSAAAYQAAEEHAKQSEKSDIAQSAADKPAAEPSAMVDESADRKSAAETSESSATPDASRSHRQVDWSRTSPVAPRVEPSLTVRDERDERTMPLPLPMPRRNWSAYALPEHWTSSICPPRGISSPFTLGGET